MTKNAASLPQVVFIHGMWCNHEAWYYFQPAFEAAGFRTHAPSLRYHDMEPGAVPPRALGATSLSGYISDLTAFIESLHEKPVLVGHSMGGLLAQILASRGLAKAAILLAPAAPAGIFAIRPGVIRIFAPVMLKWGFWRKPVFPAYKAVRYGILNEVPEDEARLLYALMVPESGRAICEIAFWPLDPQKAAAAPVEKVNCPLLVIAGAKDRITPVAICRKVARRYGDLVRYEELPGHAHWLPGEPGWEKIAQRCMEWVREKAA